MKRYNEIELAQSIRLTDGVTFKESGLVRETYDSHKARIAHAARHFTGPNNGKTFSDEDTKGHGSAKIKFSYNPMKDDTMSLRSAVQPDSVLDKAIRIIRRERQSKTLECLQLDKLPEEVGMTDKMFGDTAKMTGNIPRSFAEITDSGNYKYGKDQVEAFITSHRNHVLELRVMAAEEKTTAPKVMKKEKAAA